MRPAPHASVDRMTESLPENLPRAVEPPNLSVTTGSAEETRRVGETLGRLLRPGDLVLLQGPLGAGKTTFTQGVARGMGLASRVTSPSFTLANVYEPNGHGFNLNHLDLWRIKSPEEALGIGLDEYLSEEAGCIVEWPDVADTVFPNEHLRIRFTADGAYRELAFRAVGERPNLLVDAVRRDLPTLRLSGESGGARAPGH
jgi:tRNA threonylcarbamoyladenosine biosynthesis protein TsaE